MGWDKVKEGGFGLKKTCPKCECIKNKVRLGLFSPLENKNKIK